MGSELLNCSAFRNGVVFISGIHFKDPR